MTKKRDRVTGLDVIGYISGCFGQAVVARNIVRCAQAVGLGVTVHNAPAHGRQTVCDDAYLGRQFALPRPSKNVCNLIVMNPPDFKSRLGSDLLLAPVASRCNAIVPFWELDVLPPAWKESLKLIDVVLAPSRFVADTIRREIPDLPIIHFPQAVFLPEHIVPDRPMWGIADDEVAFCCSFDVTSDINRKNPWAAIKAFQVAFSEHQRVRLIIKVNNASADLRYAHLLEQLRERVATDARITLVERSLTYEEILGLYASCDVIVSLHRSEGLGLVPMEAMSLGKPVIVTAWSGTTDFTTPVNSALVDFTLIPVEASHLDYTTAYVGSTAQWAEPNINHAAQWMRRLADNPSLRTLLGDRARKDMLALERSYLEGKPLEDLLEYATTSAPNSVRRHSSSSLIRKERRRQLLRRMARAALKVPKAFRRSTQHDSQ